MEASTPAPCCLRINSGISTLQLPSLLWRYNLSCSGVPLGIPPGGRGFWAAFPKKCNATLMCSKLTISLGCQGSPIAHSSSSFPQRPSWPGMCTQVTGYPSRLGWQGTHPGYLLIFGGHLLGVIYYEKYCWVLCQMLRTHRWINVV